MGKYIKRGAARVCRTLVVYHSALPDVPGLRSKRVIELRAACMRRSHCNGRKKIKSSGRRIRQGPNRPSQVVSFVKPTKGEMDYGSLVSFSVLATVWHFLAFVLGRRFRIPAETFWACRW